jgi:hypothetical protein
MIYPHKLPAATPTFIPLFATKNAIFLRYFATAENTNFLLISFFDYKIMKINQLHCFSASLLSTSPEIQ